jgi:hypothetical protein
MLRAVLVSLLTVALLALLVAAVVIARRGS